MYTAAMRSLHEQIAYYQQNWERFYPLFGSIVMAPDPNPLYWIGLKLPTDSASRIDSQVQVMRTADGPSVNHWLSSDELHITLALPGRPGKPYTEQELPSLIKTLRLLAIDMPPITVRIGDINCFPNTLFREVYSDDARLFSLHERISDRISFSEEPQYRYEHYTPHMSVCYLRQKETVINLHSPFDRRMTPETVTFDSLHFHIVSDISDMAHTPVAEIEFGTGLILDP